MNFCSNITILSNILLKDNNLFYNETKPSVKLCSNLFNQLFVSNFNRNVFTNNNNFHIHLHRWCLPIHLYLWYFLKITLKLIKCHLVNSLPIELSNFEPIEDFNEHESWFKDQEGFEFMPDSLPELHSSAGEFKPVHQDN